MRIDKFIEKHYIKPLREVIKILTNLDISEEAWIELMEMLNEKR